MSSYKQISVEETKEMISSDIYLLDIRDKSSYSSSHISGAIHVSNESIDEFVANADKDKKTIIYCYKGISSRNTAQYFFDIGFKDVFSMQGGYEMWIDSDV